MGVGYVLVSPPPQSGVRAWGGGAVTFLVAEWPRGRGWVVMAMRIVFGGELRAFPPPAHTPVSPGCGEGLVCAGPSWGEGLDLCPQRPLGKGGGAQKPEDSKSGARCPSDLCPGPHPFSWVCVSSFPSTQLPCLLRPLVGPSVPVSVC